LMRENRPPETAPLPSTRTDSVVVREWSLLNRTSLFRDVAQEAVVGYLESCRLLHPGPGEILIRPERRNQFVFLLVRGELQVFLELADASPIATVVVGECVGELSIIDNQMPTAYVVASRESELLAIDHQLLWAMVDASHTIARNLLHIVTQRVRQSGKLIARRTEALREYQRSSTLDALTDLHNRRWLEVMYARELQRCAKANEPVSLLVIDVDNFKNYNDRFGHLAGDEVLRTVAHTLRIGMRPNDMAARFGGDELAILLPDCAIESAGALAERLRAGVSAAILPPFEAGVPPSPTVSIGVAEYHAGDSLQDLMARADGALYEAKLAGRNCVRSRR
jgi:diguanylate cyclase (GGDEF)-like protein